MSWTGHLLSAFFALCLSGTIAAGLLSGRRGPMALSLTGFLSSALLLVISGNVLLRGTTLEVWLWELPLAGRLLVRMDVLSSLFMFVTGMVFMPVSIFSAGYLRKYLGRYSLKTFGCLYHLLFASIVLVLIAGDVVFFLLAWEGMSIICYLLVNYEYREEQNIRSGFLMLSMGEAGTLAIALGLIIVAEASGGLDFASLKVGSQALSAHARWAVFILTFLGFGVKAGLVPVSSWLPKAHPAAPGNVSALLSGAILNLGVYGIIRVDWELLGMTDPAHGLVVLLVGSLSALLGILYATIRNDMKRMLAHSSIENMGIVTAGLGAAFVFGSSGLIPQAGIALLASLYHMVNHSVYKSLLFLGAASLDSRLGIRDMDRMGGLARGMPWTSLFFLVGALSISALPPFNGFVSEWLTLQSLLRIALLDSTAVKIVFALCGAGLALTAGLAVTCFVKAFAMSFLGVARSEEAREAREVPASMRWAMALLAVCCLGLGVLPTHVIPVLDRPVAQLVGASTVNALVPPFFTVEKGDPEWDEAFLSEFHDLGAEVGRGLIPGRGLVVLHRGTERNPVVFAMSSSYSLAMLVLLLGSAFLSVWFFTRSRKVVRRPAWDGGVRRLTSEMTYTATGFSNPVRVIFEAVFQPSKVQSARETVAEHFRTAIMTGPAEETHLLDRSVYGPMMRLSQKVAQGLARMHTGSVNAYAAYVLVSLVGLLVVWLLI